LEIFLRLFENVKTKYFNEKDVLLLSDFMFGGLKKKLENIVTKTEKTIEEKEEIQEVEIKEEVKEIKTKTPEEKKSFKDKFVKSITETKITEKDLDNALQDFEFDLLEADVAFETSEKIKEDIKNELIGQSVSRTKVKDYIITAFKNSIENILETPKYDIISEIKKNKPSVVLFLGFNGAGKTTNLAKFSKYLKKHGVSSVFAAGDTFRAASIEQLEIHGKNLNTRVIKHNYGSDAAAVVFDAKEHAKSRGIDAVLVDTAGRSHANANLMDELKKILKVNKPDIKILVLDSMTGNDIVDQCKVFDEAAGVDAIILSKLDVSNKGGSVLTAAHILKKPIIFLGEGQEYDDLIEYNKDIIVKKIFN